MATGRMQVAPGQTIQSAWGNPLWDQSVQCFLNAADRDNQYPTGARHKGAITWRDDAAILEVWDGTVWRAVRDSTKTPPIASGGPVVFNFGGGAGPVGVAVTFPVGIFTGLNMVITFGIHLGSYGGTKTPRLSQASGSTAGFTFNCYLEGGGFTGTINGYWIATAS